MMLGLFTVQNRPWEAEELSGTFLSRIGRWFGWLALVLLLVSVVSGYAWDVRTTEYVSILTGGLLNRMIAADVHTYGIPLLILVLVVHIVVGVRKRLASDANP